LLGLGFGELELAVQDEAHLVGAIILKKGFLQGCRWLGDGRERGFDVGGFLQSVEHRGGDLVAQGDAEVAGAEQVAQQSIGFDASDLGGKMQSGGVDGRSELDFEGSFATRDFGGGSGADPALDVQADYGQAVSGREWGESRILNGNAFAAARRAGEFGVENGDDVLLQIGKIGDEPESENAAGSAGRGARNRAGGDDDS